MDSSINVFKDNAVVYSEYDLSIIPCYGKKPAISAWPDYCKRRPTEKEIDSWLKLFNSNAGISLPLGEANNLIAVDFDYDWPDDVTKQPKDISREEFEKEKLEIEKKVLSLIPNTPCKKIGKPGKWTAFYRPNCIAKTFSVDRRGLRVFDVLYSGKHTVIPPSIHPDTKLPYTWVGQDIISSLDLLPELNLEDLENYGRTLETKSDNVNGEKTYAGRNDLLKTACYGMFKRGFTAKAAANQLLEIDIEKNQPPLFSDQDEFPKTYKTPEKSARAFVKSNYASMRDLVFQEPKHKAQSKHLDDSGESSDTFKPEQFGYYFLYLIPKTDGGIKKVYVPQYELMADDTFKNKNMCFDDSKSLFFNGKHWELMSKNSLNNYIWNKNVGVIKPAHLDSFAKSIKAKCYTGDFNFQDTTSKINCNNGVIDVVSGKFEENSHKYMYRYALEVDYNKDNDCPKWITFLDQIFKEDKELIKLVQHIFGYVLIGGNPFLHRAFVLYGTGRNGKSTLLDVLRALIGHGSYSTVSMAKIDREFSAVALDGKLANIVEETPTDEINSEIFKAMVGGGEVQVAHKGYEEYTLRVKARFLFACNEMPVFKDKSVGLADRLVFIPFERYFAEDERDTSIDQKLMSELSGILNWAIEGAKEIAQHKTIKIPAKCLETKEIYKIESDSIYAWFEECVSLKEENGGVSVSYMYAKYVEWATAEGHKPYGKNNFSKRVKIMLTEKCKKIGLSIDNNFGKFYVNGKQVRGYIYVSID